MNIQLNNTIDDMVSDLLYYDRKEDEDLPMGKIELMIKNRQTSVDEIVSVFKEKLIEGVKE